jgi:hypothetical protein
MLKSAELEYGAVAFSATTANSRMLGFHTCGYEEYYLLGYSDV